MPINMADKYVVDEWIPPSIIRIGTALKAFYSQPASSFGSRGNEFHSSGYHRSERWIRNSPDSLRKDQDYSLRGTANHSQDTNAVSAFDFTPHHWGTDLNQQRMITLTRNVYNAARANDPRLANLYEFAGTLNGTSVVTFNAQGGAIKNPFDATHLEHVHGSIYRSRQLNDHGGIISVMLGGGDMPLTPQETAVLQRIDERIGTIIGGLPVAPSLGDTNHVRQQLVDIRETLQSVLQDVMDLVARPPVPPVTLTSAQIDTAALLIAGKLSTNDIFLQAVANATADKLKSRLEN